MRPTFAAMLLSFLALAGCLDGGNETDPGTDPDDADSDGDGYTDAQEQAVGSDPDDAGSQPQVPESLHFEGTLRGAGESVQGSSTGCTAQDSGQDPGCADHTVEVPSPGWRVTFTLAPGEGTVTMSPDYDLYILDADGEQIADSTEPGGMEDKVSRTLNEGTYTARVQAWDNQDAPYTLDVTFAFP